MKNYNPILVYVEQVLVKQDVEEMMCNMFKEMIMAG